MRRLTSLILIGAIGFAACGKASGSEEADDNPRAAMEDAMVEFAQCMRDEGIDFPDPKEGGGLIITPENGMDPDDPDFKAAEEKCQPIIEEAEDDMPKPSAEEAEEMRENMLAFAECMRENGVDFPDPQFDGEGRITMRAEPGEGGGPAFDDPDFEAAQEKCAKDTGGPMIRRSAQP